MHGGTSTRLFVLMAALATCAGSAMAQHADDVSDLPSDNPSYNLRGMRDYRTPDAAGPLTEDRRVEQAGFHAADADLAARVKDLEAALKKIQDKEAADKKKAASAPSIKPFGKIHWDSATFGQNMASLQEAGDMLNGTEFRRARIGIQGEAFHVTDYRIEMDFAGEVSFKDVYMTVKHLPWVGNVRAGHFKECFSLEILNSDDFTMFMERSLIDAGQVLGHLGDRNPGVMAFDWNQDETITWQYGVFAFQALEKPPIFPKTTIFDDANGASFDARMTWLPWVYDADDLKERGLLHTGVAYSYRSIARLSKNAPAGAIRYLLGALPESNLANPVVDTATTNNPTALNDTDHVNALRPELAFEYGPFLLQSEYMWLFLARSQHHDTTFDGGYIQASYFLTGEHRTYYRQLGYFRNVTPFENFFRVRGEDGKIVTGVGAWELAYRCSYLNLSNQDIYGGRVTDQTIGLTWYLSPYSRLMFNFVHSEATDRNVKGVFYGRGIANIFETRVQT